MQTIKTAIYRIPPLRGSGRLAVAAPNKLPVTVKSPVIVIGPVKTLL